MARTTPNMSLAVWDLISDNFNHTELAANWDKLDGHDHATIGVPIPVGGLASNAVVNGSIADGAVTNTKLGANAVDTGKLADNAVSTIKLQDNSVTTAKIPNSAITSAKIVDGTIATVDIGDGQVAKLKLATDALNTFLKLGTAGDVAIRYGVSATGSFGGGNRLVWNIAHGLGRTPVIGFAQAGTLQTSGDAGTVPVVGSVNVLNSTTLGAVWQTVNSDLTSQSCPVYWVVIG